MCHPYNGVLKYLRGIKLISRAMHEGLHLSTFPTPDKAHASGIELGQLTRMKNTRR